MRAGSAWKIYRKKNVAVSLEKVKDGMWELTPKKDLPQGQYARANPAAGPVADFSIE
jgi:hypothetical protein